MRQLAMIATQNQKIPGSTASFDGALKEAKAINENEVIDKILTYVILVMCGTLTNIVPFANLVIMEKNVIAN